MSLDIFNVFNRTDWGANTGIGGDELSEYQVGLPTRRARCRSAPGSAGKRSLTVCGWIEKVHPQSARLEPASVCGQLARHFDFPPRYAGTASTMLTTDVVGTTRRS